jgi:hypothetical protein
MMQHGKAPRLRRKRLTVLLRYTSAIQDQQNQTLNLLSVAGVTAIIVSWGAEGVSRPRS